MGYYLSQFFGGRAVWLLLVLAALFGLLAVDLITYFTAPEPMFDLWVVKGIAAAAVGWVFLAGIVLSRREHRERHWRALETRFIARQARSRALRQLNGRATARHTRRPAGAH